MNLVAIVVTYNRKILLQECIDSILNQTVPINELIIVDNNSTDGTYEMLGKEKYLDNSKICYKKLEKNIGGAGGFYEGIKEAIKHQADWVWIMDDDTIPNDDCLEKILTAKEKLNNKNISFFASSIYGENGEYMNVPTVDTTVEKNGYQNWYEFLADKMIKINIATFVSLLINGEAIKKVGLPCKQYFIWGDDTEYTMRMTKYYGPAYMVGDSIAIHKRKLAKAINIVNEEEKSRIPMYYYMIRNNLINTKEYNGTRKMITLLIQDIKSIILVAIKGKYKLQKIMTILKGIFAFLFKRYDVKAFKNRFII